jgi:hypothetical protein
VQAPTSVGPPRVGRGSAAAGAGAGAGAAGGPPHDSGDAVDVSNVSVDELSALFSLKDAGKVEEQFAGEYKLDCTLA